MGTSGDIAECHNRAGYVWHLMCRDQGAAKHSKMHRIAHHAELSNPNQPLMYCVGYERHWSKE